MSRRRRLTRKQERLIFARLHEEAGRRRENIPPRITNRQEPRFQQMVDWLKSGKSTDPRIQAIKDKLRGESSGVKKSVSFNPGQSNKGFKFGKIPGQKEKRLVRGKMKDVPMSVPLSSGEMQPEFVNRWTPSSKEKAKLWGRASAFVDRIRKNQIAKAINKVSDKKFKDRQNSYEEALLRRAQQSNVLPELSKSDKELLRNSLKIFGAKAVEEEYKPTAIERLYGSKGYHIVPKMQIRSQTDQPIYDRHRVIYPRSQPKLFNVEREQSFKPESYKKTPLGEYILRHQPAKYSTLISRDQPYSYKGGVDVGRMKAHSPFRSVLGQSFTSGRIVPPSKEIIATRKAAGAFIVDESGIPLIAPKHRLKETEKISAPYGGWMPGNIFDRMKWESPHTTPIERNKMYEQHIKEREMNPLRQLLQDAEYQTYLKRTLPSQNERFAQALKTVENQRQKSTQRNIIQHAIISHRKKMKQRDIEKKKLGRRIEKLEATSRERSQKTSLFQKVKRFIL